MLTIENFKPVLKTISKTRHFSEKAEVIVDNDTIKLIDDGEIKLTMRVNILRRNITISLGVLMRQSAELEKQDMDMLMGILFDSKLTRYSGMHYDSNYSDYPLKYILSIKDLEFLKNQLKALEDPVEENKILSLYSLVMERI